MPSIAPKSNIIGSIIVAIVLSAVGLGLFLWYGHNEKLVDQSIAIEECETTGYDKLIGSGLINQNTTREQVQLNCKTLETRIHTILDKYEADWFPVYITGHLVSDCGDYSTGCVIARQTGVARHLPMVAPPVMTISYTADYYHGLEDTVTHEYIHTLTSVEELEYLESNPGIFPAGTDPIEGVADCGISHLTGKEFKGGSYMVKCTPEQTEVAIKIIEDTLIK